MLSVVAEDDYKLVVMGTYAQGMWTAQLLENGSSS